MVKTMCSVKCNKLDEFQEYIEQEIERTRLINNRLTSYGNKRM